MTNRKRYFRLRLEADHEPILDARTEKEEDLERMWARARRKLS